jgi:hypothetical protein
VKYAGLGAIAAFWGRCAASFSSGYSCSAKAGIAYDSGKALPTTLARETCLTAARPAHNQTSYSPKSITGHAADTREGEINASRTHTTRRQAALRAALGASTLLPLPCSLRPHVAARIGTPHLLGNTASLIELCERASACLDTGQTCAMLSTPVCVIVPRQRSNTCSQCP